MAMGSFTGIFTSIAICPFEVLKVRLQVAGPRHSLFGEMRHVLKTEGFGGLYRGIIPLMSRDVPFNTLYERALTHSSPAHAHGPSILVHDRTHEPHARRFYGSYETICTGLLRLRGLQSKDELDSVSIFFAGGLAGCLGWSVVLPFDVVKTRLQAGSTKTPMLQLMGKIVREEGAAALFNGWSAAIVRAFPANAGLFLGAELMTRALRDV
jgi:solute carrier family 25 ornithine transporter 2/15